MSIASSPTPARLVSLDAYRGFVMFLMLAEALRFAKIAASLPGNWFWAFLGWSQTHVEWTGCSLHDLIQPSFSFIVGVALPFSIAGRLARGASRRDLSLHAFGRALLLVALGVFLRSVGKPQTNFTFEDTLSQIGLGYGFLFLLGFRPVRDQWMVFGGLLALFWAAFALHPLPSADFDFSQVKVPPEWLAQHGLHGFAAHWQKNSNLSWAFDTWFLNLWPRTEPWVAHPGGYATLSFIPTLATMILGLIAGETLRSDAAPSQKVRWLVFAGLTALASGFLLGALGICPVVKRIWTPSWALFSGGWCLLLLALFYEIIDRRGHKTWTLPLVVIGMNSIAAYCMDHLWLNFIRSSLKTHLGANAFLVLGPAYESLLLGGASLAVLWLILYWMYRQKLFIKI
ncbi:MAG: putative acyltransferase/Predicted acyltransferase [Verrucomicrobia bacterium]|nr:MAG: putative acyltransferase/Predicted acyltransferase [Verrucomicrobiota bacterium]